MASTTGNDKELTSIIANGDWPDADVLMAILDMLNDKVWISTTAPASPYNGQFWLKYDEDPTIALRIYVVNRWMILPLMELA